MQVPESVIAALMQLPDRPSGTIILRFGPSKPEWIVEYDEVFKFGSYEAVVAYMRENGLNRVQTTLHQKGESWRVIHPVRREFSA